MPLQHVNRPPALSPSLSLRCILLQASKVLADDIKAKQKVADETEAQIDVARQGASEKEGWARVLQSVAARLAHVEACCRVACTWGASAQTQAPPRASIDPPAGYQPVAHHASLLYLCCVDLGALEAMYQFSLPWFRWGSG